MAIALWVGTDTACGDERPSPVNAGRRARNIAEGEHSQHPYREGCPRACRAPCRGRSASCAEPVSCIRRRVDLRAQLPQARFGEQPFGQEQQHRFLVGHVGWMTSRINAISVSS